MAKGFGSLFLLSHLQRCAAQVLQHIYWSQPLCWSPVLQPK